MRLPFLKSSRRSPRRLSRRRSRSRRSSPRRPPLPLPPKPPPDGLTTIAPIHVSGIRLGSLIIWRNDKKFEDEDLILVEIASTVVGIQLLNFQREEDEKNIRRRTAVTMAVNTLSYSELRAVSAILAELNGNEGQLTASVIADRIGITRSVIVNALRKLESAGIIESRSLGMKGTYLKVLIPDIFEEVKKRDY